MGDVNQLNYVKRHVPSVSGPVLEIGSKDYGSTPRYRDIYPGCEYVGADMEPGQNVDVVVDLTSGTGGLQKNHFALAICCSVLEHVRKPWLFAENLASLLRDGGSLCMSVPWVWRYHAYPDDYFRFSWRGIIELFPGFTWRHICYSTNLTDEFIAIPLENPGVDNQMAKFIHTPSGKRKYLPYLNVNMIGDKTSLAG